jgi:hypothetical protein
MRASWLGHAQLAEEEPGPNHYIGRRRSASTQYPDNLLDGCPLYLLAAVDGEIGTEQQKVSHVSADGHSRSTKATRVPWVPS